MTVVRHKVPGVPGKFDKYSATDRDVLGLTKLIGLGQRTFSLVTSPCKVHRVPRLHSREKEKKDRAVSRASGHRPPAR